MIILWNHYVCFCFAILDAVSRRSPRNDSNEISLEIQHILLECIGTIITIKNNYHKYISLINLVHLAYIKIRTRRVG